LLRRPWAFRGTGVARYLLFLRHGMLRVSAGINIPLLPAALHYPDAVQATFFMALSFFVGIYGSADPLVSCWPSLFGFGFRVVSGASADGGLFMGRCGAPWRFRGRQPFLLYLYYLNAATPLLDAYPACLPCLPPLHPTCLPTSTPPPACELRACLRDVAALRDGAAATGWILCLWAFGTPLQVLDSPCRVTLGDRLGVLVFPLCCAALRMRASSYSATDPASSTGTVAFSCDVVTFGVVTNGGLASLAAERRLSRNSFTGWVLRAVRDT